MIGLREVGAESFVDVFIWVSCMKRMFREVSWFIGVGCVAAATHWIVAIAYVDNLSFSPLIANVMGWLVAFLVSFTGHYRLTFRHQPKQLLVALRRFFLVSATGFMINEAAYAYLLQVTKIHYDVLLAGILIAIACLTFLVSRLWAFRHRTKIS